MSTAREDELVSSPPLPILHGRRQNLVRFVKNRHQLFYVAGATVGIRFNKCTGGKLLERISLKNNGEIKARCPVERARGVELLEG